jgi:hypothetical protein
VQIWSFCMAASYCRLYIRQRYADAGKTRDSCFGEAILGLVNFLPNPWGYSDMDGFAGVRHRAWRLSGSCACPA